jgi:hypothetical protein
MPATKLSRYHQAKVAWSNFESAEEALDVSRKEKAERQPDAAKILFCDRGQIDAVFRDKVASLPLRKRTGANVRIRAFASDRLVCSIYPESGGRISKRSRLAKRGRKSSPVLRLDKRRETRRHVVVGNRARFLPAMTRFTNHAKNMLMDGAYVIETHKDCQAVFVTLTFPGSTDQSRDVISMASGYIIDRLNRWLRYKAFGGLYCYVWELTKRGFPHLHIVLAVHETSNTGGISELLQQEWRAILLDVCEQSACDVFERHNGGSWIGDRRVPFISVRRISTGVAKYVSKYVSKARSKCSKTANFRPGRWTGVSKQLRALVLSKRLEVVIRFPSLKQARRAAIRSIEDLKPIFSSVFKCTKNAAFQALTYSCASAMHKGSKHAAMLVAHCKHAMTQSVFSLPNISLSLNST